MMDGLDVEHIDRTTQIHIPVDPDTMEMQIIEPHQHGHDERRFHLIISLPEARTDLVMCVNAKQARAFAVEFLGCWRTFAEQFDAFMEG